MSKISKSKVYELFEYIKNADKICLVGHISPDGDCIGSVMALYDYVKNNLKKDVCVAFDGDIPFNYTYYLSNAIEFSGSNTEEFDLTIVLDCGDDDRLGINKCVVLNAKKTICIDHHKTNTGFADLNIVYPEISSTGELLYEILAIGNVDITLFMADCLYVAIVTDTGNFIYSSTSSNTHIVAAKLLELGIDTTSITNRLYASTPVDVMKAYIECISSINFYYDNKFALSKITQDIVKRNDIRLNDIQGVVEFMREINEVEISCVLKEYSSNSTKVSLRSKNKFDVSEIAQKLGGGGHKRAAGFQLEMSLDEAESKLIEILNDCFN